MNIAIYPGSFDPPHLGHTMVASYVAQWGEVDEVWLMPSAINPLKVENGPKGSDAARLAMCREAVKKLPNVDYSSIELTLPRPSYTYDTLLALRSRFPGYRFRLIIGSDNWLIFSRWRNAERIIREFGLIVYPRPGYDVDPDSLPENVTLLPEAPMMLVSSTFIRKAIADGKNPAGFVMPGVAEYIAKYRLYQPC